MTVKESDVVRENKEKRSVSDRFEVSKEVQRVSSLVAFFASFGLSWPV